MKDCPDSACQRRKVGWYHLVIMVVAISVIGGYAYTADMRSGRDMIKQNAAHIEENAKQITELVKETTKATTDIGHILRSQEDQKAVNKEILKELKKINGGE